MFEICTLKFIKNESLTHTVNFGIGSAFSKCPTPGPGPLYKVYPSRSCGRQPRNPKTGGFKELFLPKNDFKN